MAMENPPLKPPFSWKISPASAVTPGGTPCNRWVWLGTISVAKRLWAQGLRSHSSKQASTQGTSTVGMCLASVPLRLQNTKQPGVLKWGYPQFSIHFIIGFSLPSSRATPYEWKHPNILKNRRLALKMACFPKHGLVFFRVSSVGFHHTKGLVKVAQWSQNWRVQYASIMV